MAARQIYDPEGFRNIETDGRITGYQFRFKAQYYRGITLSIIRDIQINIDGESAKKEDIRFTVNGETFTMEEMRTVIDSDYRWEFGEFAFDIGDCALRAFDDHDRGADQRVAVRVEDGSADSLGLLLSRCRRRVRREQYQYRHQRHHSDGCSY
jgi:hypothetical protein